MSSLTLFDSSGSMPFLALSAVFSFVISAIFMGIVAMWMILKQKISDELSARDIKINTSITAEITKIKNEINTKIVDDLSSRDGSITAEIERLLTDVYKKLSTEVNTKIANELSARLFEVNSTFTAELVRNNNELNKKLTGEIAKINSRDAGYASEAQKIFSMVNNITTKVNNIEKACRNDFCRINVVIKDLQNRINQHYAVVQRSDFDQQSVSNESEANSTNESETNSSPSSSSSGSSNLSGILDITSDIKIRFKQHFDRLMKAGIILLMRCASR